MATFSKLQALIKTIHGDRAATIAALSEGFREDFGHFVRANNSESIVLAVGELKKSEKDTAVLTAISEGRKAAGLVEGYIGARTGKFSSQPEDVQAKFNDALDRAVQAFTDSLNASYAFTEKAKKTDAEKAKAKEDKEAKAQANKEAMVTAMVQSGEIVRASDVHKLEDASTQSLIAELMTRDFLGADDSFEFGKLKIYVDKVLTAKVDAELAEKAARATESTAKATATAKAKAKAKAVA